MKTDTKDEEEKEKKRRKRKEEGKTTCYEPQTDWGIGAPLAINIYKGKKEEMK
jgi:hypothetical protein